MSPFPQHSFNIECPQNRELFAFVLGELSQDRMTRVVEHCRYCPKCSNRLSTICELGVAKPHLMRIEILEGCLGDWDPPLVNHEAKANELTEHQNSSGETVQKNLRSFLTLNLILLGVFLLLGAFAYSSE